MLLISLKVRALSVVHEIGMMYTFAFLLVCVILAHSSSFCTKCKNIISAESGQRSIQSICLFPQLLTKCFWEAYQQGMMMAIVLPFCCPSATDIQWHRGCMFTQPVVCLPTLFLLAPPYPPPHVVNTSYPLVSPCQHTVVSEIKSVNVYGITYAVSIVLPWGHTRDKEFLFWSPSQENLMRQQQTGGERFRSPTDFPSPLLIPNYQFQQKRGRSLFFYAAKTEIWEGPKEAIIFSLPKRHAWAAENRI